MHYYQFNIADYRKDTMHLTPIEHYIYRALMDTYYLSETPLTLDHAELMRTHCLRSADDMQALCAVLKDFFVMDETGYAHKRCDIEIEAFHTKSKSASESAKARWDRIRCERITNALPTQSEGNANHKPITSNQELKNIPAENTAVDLPKTPKKKSTPIPPDFCVSDRVSIWAASHGHQNIAARLDHFIGYVKANGKTYIDWDEAFMNAIRGDWAKLGKPVATGKGEWFEALGKFESELTQEEKARVFVARKAASR